MKLTLVFLFVAFAAASPSGDRKMGGGMAGGLSEVALDSDEVKHAGKQAIQRINEVRNPDTYFRLTEIRNAKTQVVAGRMWHLKLYLTATTCSQAEAAAIGEDVTGEDCPPRNQNEVESCDVKLWHKLDDTYELKEIACVL